MNPDQALQLIETFRQSVLTVQTERGPTALTGADHDNFRQAMEIVKAQLAELAELKKPKPAP